MLTRWKRNKIKLQKMFKFFVDYQNFLVDNRLANTDLDGN